MKKIIFKAKTTKKDNSNHAFNNVWVEGDLIRSREKYYIHPIANAVDVDGELGRLIVMHEVIPETIECYTRKEDVELKKQWDKITKLLESE